jgi:hypothetical protein
MDSDTDFYPYSFAYFVIIAKLFPLDSTALS